jgi:CBS domain-containing protein
VLAPLLIMGGALGALEAHTLHLADSGLWAMLSMGAIMGGTMRAPFTAIAFMLELTHDVNVVPALLVACVAADMVTVLLMKRSILTEKVARRGHHVMREYAVSPLHQLRVEDVMERNVPTVPATLALNGLFARLVNEDPVLAKRQAWLLVDDDGRLVGLITRSDLLRGLERDDFEESTVLDAGMRSVVVTYPDELLDEAATRMLEHDIGRLAVVARDDPHRLLGYLGRAGILAAWLQTAREERQRDPGWLSGPWLTLQDTLKRALVSDR